jgi:hypothetical protein
MSAVAQRVSDRHRKVVALRVEGRTCGKIAREMGYASPQVVSNILNDPAVKAYHERIRAPLPEQRSEPRAVLSM